VQQVDLTRRDLHAEERFAADFGNAQVIPQAEGGSSGGSERQQLDALMARLNTVREEYMARMDAMSAADDENGKTLLEQLVAMLEQQIQELAEKRESNNAPASAESPVKD
jgi:DNA-binding ferritin-like protein